MTNIGTVNHGGTKVYEGFENRFDDLKSELKDIKDMREQVKNNPNLSKSEKKAMLKDLDKAETAIQQGLDYATKSGKYDTTSGNVQNDADHAAVEAAMARAENAMNHVETQLLIVNHSGSADVSGPRIAGDRPVSGSKSTTTADGTSSASFSTGSGTTSGASSSDKADPDSGEYMDLTDLDVDNMVKLMSTDPRAAMAELKKMDPEDRNIAMQTINQQLQNMNQMFSMMSNVNKSLHDTSKAIINNMRV